MKKQPPIEPTVKRTLKRKVINEKQQNLPPKFHQKQPAWPTTARENNPREKKTIKEKTFKEKKRNNRTDIRFSL